MNVVELVARCASTARLTAPQRQAEVAVKNIGNGRSDQPLPLAVGARLNEQSAKSRLGLTLLEVMLALSILAASFVILSQLVGIGMRAAREARELTQAQLLCESLMAEITSGAMISTATQGSIPTAPDWSYQSVMESTGQAGLVRLVVTVQNSIDPSNPISFTLSRVMRDPSLAIPVDEEPAEDSSSSGQVSMRPAGDGLRRTEFSIGGEVVYLDRIVSTAKFEFCTSVPRSERVT